MLSNRNTITSHTIRWEAVVSLDICWAQFDATRAFHKILEPRNQERIVADVLMDQEVLPGVGNIIKNEACFNAGVNPLSMIKDVPEGVIRRLVGLGNSLQDLVLYLNKIFIGETHKGVLNGLLPVQKDWQTFVQTLQDVQVWTMTSSASH